MELAGKRIPLENNIRPWMEEDAFYKEIGRHVPPRARVPAATALRSGGLRCLPCLPLQLSCISVLIQTTTPLLPSAQRSRCASCLRSPAPDPLSRSRGDWELGAGGTGQILPSRCTEAGEVGSQPRQGVFPMLWGVKERSGLAGGPVMAAGCVCSLEVPREHLLFCTGKGRRKAKGKLAAAPRAGCSAPLLGCIWDFLNSLPCTPPPPQALSGKSLGTSPVGGISPQGVRLAVQPQWDSPPRTICSPGWIRCVWCISLMGKSWPEIEQPFSEALCSRGHLIDTETVSPSVLGGSLQKFRLSSPPLFFHSFSPIVTGFVRYWCVWEQN